MRGSLVRQRALCSNILSICRDYVRAKGSMVTHWEHRLYVGIVGCMK